MNSHAVPSAPRTASRRLAWAAWLAAVVATSLGHGASYPGGTPAPESCQAGSLQITPGGQGQTGHAGAPLGRALVLQFSCTNTVDGRTITPPASEVRWAVASGGGMLNGANEVTSPAGGIDPAAVNWSLGAGVIGTQMVTASVEGRTFGFQATAVPAGDGSGQCSDSPSLNGTQFDSQRHIAGTEVWTLAGSPYRGFDVVLQAGALLQIEPGVRVCLSELRTVGGGRVQALGTAALPIHLTGTRPQGLMVSLWGQPAAPSQLRHVLGEDIAGLSTFAHAIELEDTRWQALPTPRGGTLCSPIEFAAGPDRAPFPVLVRRSVFDGFGGTNGGCLAAVYLAMDQVTAGGASVFEAHVLNSAGHGVRLRGTPGGWRLQQCEVRGSSGNGIEVESNAGPVSGCALVSNSGVGVNNLQPASFTVDARGNWWGDAAGATGAGGDGVSAGVDATMPLATPPALD